MDAAERSASAARLRREADALLEHSGLLALLRGRYGEALLTGSASYDLMVDRDIDIHMPVEAETWAEWAAFGGDIAARLKRSGYQLHKASFLNDYVDPHPLGAGLYWGLVFRDREGNPWSCDLWGWDPFDYAVRQAREANLLADLRRADRDMILRLKAEARGAGGISSFDIYQFAIARAGQSLDDLMAWKAQQS